ncbi:sensor histidine kinase [Hyphococcus sp.]|uniref:sensor histidine kinase n=1 Tax=Hyphococcus sp. TaxID=2038636 RepID=UPI003CCBC1FD
MTDKTDFLDDGGEMGRRMRETDWTAHPLGAAGHWPQALKITVRLMLTTEHPIFIFWGPELFCFYNDAYSRSFGPEKHPSALGARARDVFPEIWDIIGPQIDQVMAGEGATWHENHLVSTWRHGERPEIYWTYSYSPIHAPEAANRVGGVLVICHETTKTVELGKRLETKVEDAHAVLRETHHRVKNNIATIIAMVRLEERRIKDEALRRPLQRVRARLESFAKLYEMMLRSADSGVIDAGAYLQKLCDAIDELSAGSAEADITCNTALDRHEVPADNAIALGAIAVELITNAREHAFEGRTTGAIDVTLNTFPDKMILKIADNGAGFDAARVKPSSTGIGMELVRHYAALLGGEIDQQTDENGTVVTLAMPLA